MPLGIYSSVALIYNATTGKLEVGANAAIQVVKESDGANAFIYKDRDGSDSLSNPFNADSAGRFQFYAAGIAQGYKIIVTKGAHQYILRNQPVGTMQERDSVDADKMADQYLSFHYSGVAIDEDIIVDGFFFDQNVAITKVGLFAREAPDGAALTIDFLKGAVEQSRIATLADGAVKQSTEITGLEFTTEDAHLLLPGISGNYASTPDAAALDITGDIDLRAQVALDDWTPDAAQEIIAKSLATGNQRGYRLLVGTTGALQLQWSTDGTDSIARSSTAAVNIDDGSAVWIRATLDVDNGAGGHDVTFYTSDDGVDWEQLGDAVTTAGTTSIFSNTAALEIGSSSGGTVSPASGKIFRAQVYDGVGGTLELDADFTEERAGTVSFTESSANDATVTVNTSGSGALARIDSQEMALKIKSVGSTFEGNDLEVLIHYHNEALA